MTTAARLVHFNATLTHTRTPGSFGWDAMPSLVPTQAVPGYAGKAAGYLLFLCATNYVGFGPDGNGRNRGVVEIDGGWFGGNVRPENHRVVRVNRRRRQHQSGKRRCVVVMRQRGGPTVTAVVKNEAEAVPIIRRRVARDSAVHADEARAWDDLHAIFDRKRIDHREAYSRDGACTNQVESYISRLRRAEIGQHHHIAGPHLGQYAGEMAWREDMRRNATGV